MEVMEVVDLTADAVEDDYEDVEIETRTPSGNAMETSSFEGQADDSAMNIETFLGDLEQEDSDSVASGGAPEDAPEDAPERQPESSEADSDSFKQSHSDDEFDQEVVEFIDFDDGDPDNDSDSDEELNWQGDCVQSCQPKYEKIHEKSQIRKFRIGESRQLVAGFRAKITRMKAKIAGLKTQNRRLRADLAAARASASGPPRRTKAMWPEHLKHFLRRQWTRLPPGIRGYSDIYKLSCRELNIPSHPNRVLPGLVLREKDDDEDGAIESIAVTGGFNFNQLPPIAQFRVLQMLLCFYGKKVHVLTRLDPYHVPSLSSGVLGNDPERPQPLRRFHIGDSPLDVARTVRGHKHPRDQRNARLRILADLMPGLNPREDAWRTMALALPKLKDELLDGDDDWEDEDDNNVGDSGTSGANSSDEHEDEDSDADDGSESGSDSGSDTSDGDSVQILSGSPVAMNHQQAISIPGSPVNSNHGVQTRSIPRLSNNTNSEYGVTLERDIMEDSLPNIVDLTLEDDEDGYDDTQNEALTQYSSQTIWDDGMKAEPISEDTGANITNTNENSNTQEESLFIDANSGNSTGEVTYDHCKSQSPEEEAMRAISAHIKDSQKHGSPTSSNSDSEGPLFASPTRYDEIVHQSSSTGARTVRSEVSSSLFLGSGDPNSSRSPSSESSASKTSKRSYNGNGNNEGPDRESESRKRQRSEGPFAGGSGSSVEDCIEL
ncbi:hypothetical protein MHUMG1_00370 [Metarhizium humberi]|uniref:Uncharacterized protein n=1 Tax=Metarhizium humberi TaxID=2596975 RepID=A0A9P8MLH9_9HYPO|nr:hypothetical protein MHUMG1_00370 [Metarhizium humberi]